MKGQAESHTQRHLDTDPQPRRYINRKTQVQQCHTETSSELQETCPGNTPTQSQERPEGDVLEQAQAHVQTLRQPCTHADYTSRLADPQTQARSKSILQSRSPLEILLGHLRPGPFILPLNSSFSFLPHCLPFNLKDSLGFTCIPQSQQPGYVILRKCQGQQMSLCPLQQPHPSPTHPSSSLSVPSLLQSPDPPAPLTQQTQTLRKG